MVALGLLHPIGVTKARNSALASSKPRSQRARRAQREGFSTCRRVQLGKKLFSGEVITSVRDAMVDDQGHPNGFRIFRIDP